MDQLQRDAQWIAAGAVTFFLRLLADLIGLIVAAALVSRTFTLTVLGTLIVVILPALGVVALTVPSLGKEFRGQVRGTPAIRRLRPQGALYSAVIVLTDGHAVPPGASATVRIEIQSKAQALVVPRSAITWRRDEAYVTILRDTWIEVKKVSVGIQTDELVEITSGLAANALVILEPLGKSREDR